jgi:hypothetical protein
MAENGKDKDKLKEILGSLEPPPPAPEDPIAPATHVHTLDDCARDLLDWVAFIDPQWKERLDILRLERGWGDKEVAGALIAYPLDHAVHMEIQHNPLIMDQENIPSRRAAGPRKMTCLQCGKEFDMKLAGQRALCSNLCARGYDSIQKNLATPA